MSAHRRRLWRYTIWCDEPNCDAGVGFTTGGQPLDAEWLRYSQGSTTEGWTYVEVNDQVRDFCPVHSGSTPADGAA